MDVQEKCKMLFTVSSVVDTDQAKTRCLIPRNALKLRGILLRSIKYQAYIGIKLVYAFKCKVAILYVYQYLYIGRTPSGDTVKVFLHTYQ